MNTPMNPTFALDDKVQAFLSRLETTNAAAVALVIGTVPEPLDDLGLAPD